MNPRELVRAAVRGDDLATRQIVKDAKRSGFSWSAAPPPDFVGRRCRAAYAAVVELLARRAGEEPPSWTRSVGPAPRPLFLMGRKSKALRRQYEGQAPEPLRRRNVFASADYLDVL